MSRPVKDTPILRGDDARKFEREMELAVRRKVPRADYERALTVFRRVAQRRSGDA